MTKFGNLEFERRIFPRFTLHLPFSYELDTSVLGEGLTLNASQGGLQVYLPEKVKIGDVLRMKLSLAEKKQVRQVEVSARVAWVEKSPLGKTYQYRVGLQLTEMSPEAESFIKWFEQIWLEQSS